MKKVVRCAVYTRKSSEEGLDQSFNSLHAQREAGEAYVLSQAGEGWAILPKPYDDGGFSGGSMDRPGLVALLADVAAGKVDVVVVYKVDRLTRSLTDFARIVETFDAHGVSFVSVTQSFNTTTSMGRLTLNVLLSFAQFEREVTGERIRDKIAASKAKGMWMGGHPPLGYDAPTDLVARTLVINEPEAETVRLIFDRYLELGSVYALRDWLNEREIRSKAWITRGGRQMGGLVFNRGALFHLLKNRTYLGELPHRDITYPGSHPPIIGAKTFVRAQELLARQGAPRDRVTIVGEQMLKGLIFDAEATPMSPTFTRRGSGRVYRYYVSSTLQQGGREVPADVIGRVPADAVEVRIKELLTTLGAAPAGTPLVRVEVHPETLQIILKQGGLFARRGDPLAEIDTLRRRLGPYGYIMPEPGEGEDLVRVTMACRLKHQGGRVWLEGGAARPAQKLDPYLPRALVEAHQLTAAMGSGVAGRPDFLVPDQAPANKYKRRLAALAFLAPDIQTAILEGATPLGLTLEQVLNRGVPPSWEAQRRQFGFPAN